MAELATALDAFEADEAVGCTIITGSEKAFAAGADIKEMQSKTYMEVYKSDFINKWERVTTCRKRSSQRWLVLHWAAAANWR